MSMNPIPASTSSGAAQIASSTVRPPVTPSSPASLMATVTCSGSALRTNATVSSVNFKRFFLEPPYSSVRLLVRGEKNWLSR
ncbi:MAG: hypothetical protein BWY85_02116 [Firmicutes bacterium ADurb.Bin506]|nr:MAG: hypothetical protein BWY85_02116 [Firmicutes bacterium ADurb.Bin506]